MDKKIIVGFIGPSGCGKDTASDYICEKYGFKKMSFAEPLKKMVKECFILTEEQCYGDKKDMIDERWGCSPREIFQVLGTEFAQYMLPELLPSLKDKVDKRCFWVKHLMERIKKEHNHCIVISDVRFKHEVEFLLKENTYLFRIERPNVKETHPHQSEEEWKTIDESKIILITNEGTTKDLYKKLDKYFL